MAFAALAACDLSVFSPKAPIIDSRWVVPTPSTRIAVADLLPPGVTILPDSSGFTINVAGASVTRTLGQDCASCSAANGLIVPKPAFIANASIGVSPPSDISSATLTGGQLTLHIVNNYTFDPLRPAPTTTNKKGYAVITVTNGTTVLGRDSVDGAQAAGSLPANGGVMDRVIPLAGIISGTANLSIAMTMNSPAGDPFLIDASRTLTITATPANLKVASANIAVTGRTVNSTDTLDFKSIDSTISKKVLGGSLLLTISNPFNVVGTLTVKLTPTTNGAASGPTVTKSISLTAGSSAPQVDFTQAELRSLLGNKVALSYVGTVNSTGLVTVTPKQAVVVSSHLDISLEVGS